MIPLSQKYKNTNVSQCTSFKKSNSNFKVILVPTIPILDSWTKFRIGSKVMLIKISTDSHATFGGVLNGWPSSLCTVQTRGWQDVNLRFPVTLAVSDSDNRSLVTGVLSPPLDSLKGQTSSPAKKSKNIGCPLRLPLGLKLQKNSIFIIQNAHTGVTC